MTTAALAYAYHLHPDDVDRWPPGVAAIFTRVAQRRGLLSSDNRKDTP